MCYEKWWDNKFKRLQIYVTASEFRSISSKFISFQWFIPLTENQTKDSVNLSKFIFQISFFKYVGILINFSNLLFMLQVYFSNFVFQISFFKFHFSNFIFQISFFKFYFQIYFPNFMSIIDITQIFQHYRGITPYFQYWWKHDDDDQLCYL